MSVKNYLGYDPIIRDIPGYEDLYQISEDGEVYNKITGDEMSLADRGGYLCFNVSKNGKSAYFLAHRLLATIFIPNPNNRPEVDHIDRNPMNNKLENLRWVTKSQNQTNRGISSNNTSGHTGISRQANNNKEYWRADITKDNKRITESFDYTDEGLQQAIRWREEQKEKLHTYDS